MLNSAGPTLSWSRDHVPGLLVCACKGFSRGCHTSGRCLILSEPIAVPWGPLLSSPGGSEARARLEQGRQEIQMNDLARVTM